MLEAADSVLRRHPNAMVYILGRGEQRDRLRRLAEEKKLDRNLVIEYQYDPSVIVNESLVLACLETYDNTTNQSLLEGMAAGCAVIATDAGLTSTIVTPDVGFLVSNSPLHIADKVLFLLDHPETAQKMGQVARQKILQEHNVDGYIQYLRRIQDKIMSDAY